MLVCFSFGALAFERLLGKMPCLTTNIMCEANSVLEESLTSGNMCSTPLRGGNGYDGNESPRPDFDVDNCDWIGGKVDSFDESYYKIQWELEKINAIRSERKLCFKSISDCIADKCRYKRKFEVIFVGRVLLAENDGVGVFHGVYEGKIIDIDID